MIWQNEWGGKAIFSHGTSTQRGTAIFTSKEIYGMINNIYCDTEGRYIIFDLFQNNQRVNVVTLYAPNKDTPAFFRNITVKLKERSEHKIILGDFNLTLDVDLDRNNTYCNNNKAKEEVENMMDEFYLDDIWRKRNSDKREFSWSKKGDYPRKASRIDFALVSGGIDQNVELIQYLSSVQTDHRAIYLVLNLDPFERGAGFWKFNSTLLSNLDFIKHMNDELSKTINSTSTSNSSPSKSWEYIKSRIKKVSVQYSRNKTSEDKIIIGNLSEKLNEYEANLPLTQEEDALMERTREDLEEKLFEKTKSIMFRSKAKWQEEG